MRGLRFISSLLLAANTLPSGQPLSSRVIRLRNEIMIPVTKCNFPSRRAVRANLGKQDTDFNFDDIDLQDVEEIDEETRMAAEQARPPTIKIISDVMGINAFTIILTMLIILFALGNSFLGEGWLAPFLGIESSSDRMQRISLMNQKELLPEGFVMPSADEILKNIPEADLKRMLEADAARSRT